MTSLEDEHEKSKKAIINSADRKITDGANLPMAALQNGHDFTVLPEYKRFMDAKEDLKDAFGRTLDNIFYKRN